MSEAHSKDTHEKLAELLFTWQNATELHRVIRRCPKLRLAAWSALTSFDLDGSDVLLDQENDDTVARLFDYMMMPEIRWSVWFYFLADTPSVEQLREVSKRVPELKDAAEAAIRVHPEAKAKALIESVDGAK